MKSVNHVPCKNWNNDNSGVLCITKDIIIMTGLVVYCEACYRKENKPVPKKIQYIWEYFLHLRDPNKKVKKCKDRKEAIDAIEAKAKSGVKLNKIERDKLTSRKMLKHTQRR